MIILIDRVHGWPALRPAMTSFVCGGSPNNRFCETKPIFGCFGGYLVCERTQICRVGVALMPLRMTIRCCGEPNPICSVTRARTPARITRTRQNLKEIAARGERRAQAEPLIQTVIPWPRMDKGVFCAKHPLD
jgi:hypothetical protein